MFICIHLGGRKTAFLIVFPAKPTYLYGFITTSSRTFFDSFVSVLEGDSVVLCHGKSASFHLMGKNINLYDH